MENTRISIQLIKGSISKMLSKYEAEYCVFCYIYMCI